MENRKEALGRQRLRLLYSLGDFQLALSAAAFLRECDPETDYSKIELRRFRCYETTLIMAYTRPFSASKGVVPRLSLKMTGSNLDANQITLHDRLIGLRNKVVAHSDDEMMRMISKAHTLEISDDFKFVFLETVFDEGLNFAGHDLYDVEELISVVSGTVFTKLLDEANFDPDQFDIVKDHLNP